MQNPFPEPDNVSPDINTEIKEYLKSIFSNGKKITFHEISEYFIKCIEQKDIPRAKITAYYCTNVVLNTGHLMESQKSEIIASMIREINGLNFR